MGAFREQHHVPKFYFRSFSDEGRRISLVNLKSGKFVRNASLADQCKASNFYGADKRLEKGSWRD